MSVSSKQFIEGGWAGEARRLRAFLTTMSECMPPEYNEPLLWRDEELTVEQWNDLDAITANIVQERTRTDHGELDPGGNSGSVVQAYRGEARKNLINNMWRVGGDSEIQFNAMMTFEVGDIDAGEAKPLHEHSIDWLVNLIGTACASVDSDEARIESIPMSIELIRARRESIVGELTLAPHGIGDARLPDSITAYPCPVGYPEGLVLVADLERAATDPASLVPALLTLDDILKTHQP